MQPIKTNFCNTIFIKEGCSDLPAVVTDNIICTYWKPNKEELAEIASGMPIRLSIQSSSMPPICIDVETF